LLFVGFGYGAAMFWFDTGRKSLGPRLREECTSIIDTVLDVYGSDKNPELVEAVKELRPNRVALIAQCIGDRGQTRVGSESISSAIADLSSAVRRLR
jgi:hypothetical protein